MIKLKIIKNRSNAIVCGLLLCSSMATPAFSQEGAKIESLKITIKKQSNTGMTAQELLQQMEAASKNKAEFEPELIEKPIEEKETIKETPPITVQNKIEEPSKTQPVPKIVKTKKAPITSVAKKKRASPKRASAKKVYKRTYTPSALPPPLPNIKPDQPKYVEQLATTIIDYRNIPDGVTITKDLALRIALEYAPPARSFTVFEGRDYNGTIVYQVSFKTDEGMHDILVDAQNGKVLKR